MNPAREINRLIRRALKSGLRPIWGASHAGVRRFRLGITPRLAIALVGVAILALAANFMVEQAIVVEKTTTVTRMLRPAEVAIPSDANRHHEPPPLRDDEARVRVVLTADAVMMAFNRLSESTRDRIARRTSLTESDYQRSADELGRTTTELNAQAIIALSGKPIGGIAAGIKAHRALGDSLVEMSDRRRDLLDEYTAILERLSTNVKRSLDGSWKMFGRVLARQSLLTLGTDLNEVRRHSTLLGSAQGSESTDMSALARAEAAVRAILDSNERGFRRSEGDAWYTSMQSGFTTLVTVRESIARSNDYLRVRSQAFIDQRLSLEKAISQTLAAQALTDSRSVDQTNAAVSVPISPAAPAATVHVPEGDGTDLVPTMQTSSVTRQPPDGHDRRLVLASISVGVLVLLVLVSIGTIRSIVAPVRQLLRATTQLAHGRTQVRVPRGGIRELDTLALAFNNMADELDKARAESHAYQEQLEDRVTERTRQLQALAEQDPLTGLPNRRELFVLLNTALERAATGGHRVGVFFLDIDNFKYINDSMGHAFGDRVLVSFARRLDDVARPVGFAARLGGDEFTVVFEAALSIEEVRTAGLRMVQAFQQPLVVDGRDLMVSVSVGAGIFPEHESTAEALLKAADAALFRAKTLGRSQLSVFTPDLLQDAAARFTTEQALSRAVERGEFELVFQPEVSATTFETVLVEALIRWRMPDGRLAPPSEFLAIAEQSGLIVDINDWVIQSAIETAAQWHHGAWPHARVAINVTPRQLLDPGFVARLCALLHANRLPTHCIEIELTESVLQTGPSTLEALKELTAHGVAIALDDFGTGYSSLASIEQLPLSRIKLDQTLIARIDSSPRSAAIASAIIRMCEGLNLEITAEGVERPEQFALLIEHPGMFLQGYLLARPTPAEDLLAEFATVTARAQELFLQSSTRQRKSRPRSLETPLREESQNG